jgi:signal transduction histidine kinase
LSSTRLDGRDSARVFRHGSSVTVEVSDTGPGIPQGEVPFLFEEFYRGERADTRNAPGDGLGLAIAKQAMEQQGATIAVKSMPRQGTTFSVTLPYD